MSKFSDNASDGNHQKNMDKYKTTKQGLVAQGSGVLGDLKIENSKNQTFNSELEESASAHGLNTNNLVSSVTLNPLQP